MNVHMVEKEVYVQGTIIKINDAYIQRPATNHSESLGVFVYLSYLFMSIPFIVSLRRGNAGRVKMSDFNLLIPPDTKACRLLILNSLMG